MASSSPNRRRRKSAAKAARAADSDLWKQVEGAQIRRGPQTGPQTAFFESPADIVIYGGQAGGGKSWAMEYEALRWRHVPGFTAMIFRRTTVQVTNPGGLWDESMTLYPLFGGSPQRQRLEWTFALPPREDGKPHEGAFPKVKFGHLEHEKTVLEHGGSQYCYIGFDELTLFTRYQFFFMLSRNRSTCGVAPYIRAGCNPDADSWVAEFISWWIDQSTGFPIKERVGVLRWFVRVGDEIKWGDSAEELIARYPLEDLGEGAEGVKQTPKSVTFIPASVFDNKILIQKDPAYLANLMALPMVERERLLKGNWKVRPSAGMFFRREWLTKITAAEIPPATTWVRGWDLASTPKTQNNDPDWTSGVKIGRMPDGRYVVAHNRRDRVGPKDVEAMLVACAASDGKACTISVPQDPGQAGKWQVLQLTQLLDGYPIRSTSEEGDKIVRFSPFSAQCEGGNVCYLEGDWNEPYFSALEAFPESAHDDDVDATSRAYQAFHDNNTGLLEHYRREAEKLKQEQRALPGGVQVEQGTLAAWAAPGRRREALAAAQVLMRAPDDVSTVYGIDGSRYTVQADRTVAVQPADVAPLSRRGFVLVETHKEQAP